MHVHSDVDAYAQIAHTHFSHAHFWMAVSELQYIAI